MIPLRALLRRNNPATMTVMHHRAERARFSMGVRSAALPAERFHSALRHGARSSAPHQPCHFHVPARGLGALDRQHVVSVGVRLAH